MRAKNGKFVKVSTTAENPMKPKVYCKDCANFEGLVGCRAFQMREETYYSPLFSLARAAEVNQNNDCDAFQLVDTKADIELYCTKFVELTKPQDTLFGRIAGMFKRK